MTPPLPPATRRTVLGGAAASSLLWIPPASAAAPPQGVHLTYGADPHNHCYERTHPVRDGAPVVEAPRGAVVDSRRGTTYLTAGGAGQAVYPVGGQPLSYVTVAGGARVPEATTWSSVTDAQHSIGFVDVTPRDRNGVARMRLTALATDGSVIDRVTLRRPSRAGE